MMDKYLKFDFNFKVILFRFINYILVNSTWSFNIRSFFIIRGYRYEILVSFLVQEFFCSPNTYQIFRLFSYSIIHQHLWLVDLIPTNFSCF